MTDNIGKLILRLMVGGLMLFHGIDKALHGISPIKGMLKASQLPEILAYGVYVGEILAPLFLILGWKSRWWAGVIMFNMLVAIYLVHAKTLWALGAHGAWSIETPLFFLLGTLTIVFIGSGRYAIMRD